MYAFVREHIHTHTHTHTHTHIYRRALNAASGIGLKPGGLTIKACCMLYWSIKIPIITFASELWILNDYDINALDTFQKYAGRRVQRFHLKSPSATSFIGLGWIRLEVFIYVKKLLFLRTISVLGDNCVYKIIGRMRANKFNNDIASGMINTYHSTVFDILKTSILFGVYNESMRMLNGEAFYTKAQWK